MNSKRLQTCYSPRYYAITPTNSMEKLTAIADVLIEENITDFLDPGLVDVDILRNLHDPNYVDAFINGQKPLATIQGFRKWNEQLRDAVLSVQAGQLVAAEIAFQEGVASNLAQGFHHATYEWGNAFCTFNGLALIAQQYPNKKIFVLDCDQHGGNGTAEFTKRLPNLFNYSVCGLPFGCISSEQSILHVIHPKTGNFQEYMSAVKDGLRTAQEWQADLIIYQAALDCHQRDPFGSQWFTDEMIFERDAIVFETIKRLGIPLLFVMAGGYQNLRDLVPLHVSTYRTVNDIYF